MPTVELFKLGRSYERPMFSGGLLRADEGDNDDEDRQ